MSMKKTIIIIIAAVIIFVLAAAAWFVFFWQPGPSYDSVAYLESPEITTLPDQAMMTLTLTGKPGDIAAEAIGALYSAWSKAGGQWSNDIAVAARWGSAEDFSNYNTTTVLTGTFALPLPSGVTELPSGIDERITKQTWQYGTVAQILHVGSYNSEQPTIDRLHSFITEQGYTIAGEHEEVYLKGPNMFGFGSEKKYLTIIRYQVK